MPALADVARLAGQHHERCDGTGYHRGLTGSPAVAALTRARGRGRVPEPGRGPSPPAGTVRGRGRGPAARQDARARRPRRGRGRGRADRRRPRAPGSDGTDRPTSPSARSRCSGSSPTGLSNRQIAERLVISARTAEHHVQDVYAQDRGLHARGRRAVRDGARPARQTWVGLPRSAGGVGGPGWLHDDRSPAPGGAGRARAGCSPRRSSGSPSPTSATSPPPVSRSTRCPPYVTGPVGSDEAGAGLAFGAFAVTALVLRPFAGRLSDTRGSPAAARSAAPCCRRRGDAADRTRGLTGAGRRAAADPRRRGGRLLRRVVRRAGRPGSAEPDR